jgi:hypothetical protein
VVDLDVPAKVWRVVVCLLLVASVLALAFRLWVEVGSEGWVPEEVDLLTPTVDTCLTRVAEVGATVVGLKGTAEALGTEVAVYASACPPTAVATAGPGPSLTARPTACRRCESGRDCPAGFVCANCRGVAWFCVPVSSINGGCADCLSRQ